MYRRDGFLKYLQGSSVDTLTEGEDEDEREEEVEKDMPDVDAALQGRL